jgi:hypothetical protein
MHAHKAATKGKQLSGKTAFSGLGIRLFHLYLYTCTHLLQGQYKGGTDGIRKETNQPNKSASKPL